MPIISRRTDSEALPASVTAKPDCCGGKQYCHDFSKKILAVLLGILLVYLTFYVGSLTRNTIKKYNYVGLADQMERTITVIGFGKVNAKNDIALTTLGYSNTDKDVGKAQTDNTKVMDTLMSELRKMGIGDKDLQTSYSIGPVYDYTDKGQQLKGYRVDSGVTIKIRDLTKISAILSLAGKYGANEVGGLSFTVDDTEDLKNQARDKALVDAKLKARKLAQSLGVTLGEVVSYNDYEAQPSYPSVYAYNKMAAVGGPEISAPADIASGSRDVGMNVNVTYKIYPARW
ncbi:MAG: SIMPL domain-containing protein [Candidatus Magasanikbacteria bacterium]|nr:SIMPL domain-containing protein [Candidatus Magasanikbacteria bacterium]